MGPPAGRTVRSNPVRTCASRQPVRPLAGGSPADRPKAAEPELADMATLPKRSEAGCGVAEGVVGAIGAKRTTIHVTTPPAEDASLPPRIHDGRRDRDNRHRPEK